MRRHTFVRSVFILMAMIGSGNSESRDWKSFPHSQARVLSNFSELASDSSELQLAIHIKLDKDWHSYWRNSGDSGASPIFSLSAEGAQVETGELHYQKPKRIFTKPLYSFAYEDETVYFLDVKLKKISSSRVTLNLESEWLVCKVECVPAVGSFQLTIPVGLATPSHEEFFSIERSKLPSAHQVLAHFTKTKSEYQITSSEKLQVIDFFPLEEQGVSNHPPQVNPDHPEQFNIKMELDKSLSSLQGLAILENGAALWLHATPQENSLSLVWILIFAFLGGLILNIMPCVLPVLSLKLFSLSKAAQSGDQKVRLESLAYSLGAILSFLIVALLLILTRASGESIGWGFQLQSAPFVIFMALLFFVLGLNFLGVYEFRIPGLNIGSKLAQKNGFIGSFFTGVLSVLVASPCTAPFMGAAIGFALTQGALVALVSFFALGLGFSFPFILFAITPKASHWIPKPGAWMNTFKKLLFIPMLLTSLWLSWVAWQILKPSISSETNKQSQLLNWQDIRKLQIESLIPSEKPVFINFTADWCLSCKVHEALVFNNSDIIKELQQRNFVLIEADWTKKDDQIAQILAKYGRASVPFYVYYPPGKSSPKILPELLTPDIFLEEIKP